MLLCLLCCVVLPQLKGACQQELTTACTSDYVVLTAGLLFDLRSLFKKEASGGNRRALWLRQIRLISLHYNQMVLIKPNNTI